MLRMYAQQRQKYNKQKEARGCTILFKLNVII